MKRYSITIYGKEKKWSFDTFIDPKYLQDYWDDNIQIDEVLNTIPEWVADIGLGKPWCFFQDLFNFKNPFKD